jgi:hypothetical protein
MHVLFDDHETAALYGHTCQSLISIKIPPRGRLNFEVGRRTFGSGTLETARMTVGVHVHHFARLGMQNVAAISELLKLFDARLMRCYPVSSGVNHVANDDAECSRPVEFLPIVQLAFNVSDVALQEPGARI